MYQEKVEGRVTSGCRERRVYVSWVTSRVPIPTVRSEGSIINILQSVDRTVFDSSK